MCRRRGSGERPRGGEGSMTFGERLRQERKNRLWKQKDMAIRCGCSQKEISEYESGKRVPGLSRIRAIATVLGIEPVEMYGLVEGEQTDGQTT